MKIVKLGQTKSLRTYRGKYNYLFDSLIDFRVNLVNFEIFRSNLPTLKYTFLIKKMYKVVLRIARIFQFNYTSNGVRVLKIYFDIVQIIPSANLLQIKFDLRQKKI